MATIINYHSNSFLNERFFCLLPNYQLTLRYYSVLIKDIVKSDFVVYLI